MATVPQELKVKTLQGEMINVTVAAANTVKELRTKLLESKGCEDPIERQLLKVEVLTLLVDDNQTVESAGLLCPESDVTVVYTRREVEAATKQSIHERGPRKGVVVPSHVTEIVPEAFEYDETILTVTIPESVTSIGAHAFDACLWPVSFSRTHWQSLNHWPSQIAYLWKVSWYLTRSLSLAQVLLRTARLWSISPSLVPCLPFQGIFSKGVTVWRASAPSLDPSRSLKSLPFSTAEHWKESPCPGA